MTSLEIKERLDKALANVEKRKATIERHKAQAEKKFQILKKNGLDDLDRSAHRDDKDAFWMIVEYERKLEDIESATDKLEEAEQIAKNWLEKYNSKLAEESLIDNEIPDAFKEAKAELVESWVAYDIKQREAMKEFKATHSYQEFRKAYKYTEQDRLSKTDEEFRKIEEADANAWLIDLFNRVKKITGEITDASHIRWGGKCLDGYVVGKEGKAIVDTIEAGGYYIQRWHLRTLVKRG